MGRPISPLTLIPSYMACYDGLGGCKSRQGYYAARDKKGIKMYAVKTTVTVTTEILPLSPADRIRWLGLEYVRKAEEAFRSATRIRHYNYELYLFWLNRANTYKNIALACANIVDEKYWR